MKTKHAARKIHPRAPWAIPGSKVPAPVPQPPQQPAEPPQGTPAPRVVRLRPEDARTSGEAFAGLLRASRPLTFAVPRFIDRLGSWIRVGAHEVRVPINSLVVIQKADNGREFALISGIDGDKRFWVLTDRADGVREVRGLSEGYRDELRRAAFGGSL